MEVGYCKTCESDNEKGIKLLGVHICKSCLDYITKLRVEDSKYEHYKSSISRIWQDYYRLKLN